MTPAWYVQSPTDPKAPSLLGNRLEWSHSRQASRIASVNSLVS